MLDKNGFKKKEYDEILEDMISRAKSQYGEDVKTSATSVLGVFLRIVSKGMATLYNVIEKVYSSGFVSQATGVQLDRLADNVGLYRLPASNSISLLEFEGEKGYEIEAGTLFETKEKRILFELIDNVKLDNNGKGKGTVVSVEVGEHTNVAANTIVVQTEPVEELTNVTNPEKAEGGKLAENDDALRKRIKESVKANPATTVNGLKTAVLGVQGVKGVNVVDNKTLETDKNGNPPKSVHVFVMGGEKNNLANAIFDSVAAGIETVGKEEVEVYDVGNTKHTVKFDYAKPKNIYAEIDVLTNSLFEIDGEQKIKEATQKVINNLSMGEKVKYSYIFPELYKIKGVVNATVKIGEDKEQMEASDIIIKPEEYANINLGDVKVVINV